MKNALKMLPLMLIGLLAIPQGAHAHWIGGYGLESGLTHPLLGLDHLLAMVAVGVISTQITPNKIWRLPALFLSFIMMGGLLAMNRVGIPFVETGIALSVLFLGVFIALDQRISGRWAAVCVALFALFHGQAHGIEMPMLAHPALYATGFVLSTALLHLVGVWIGRLFRTTEFTLATLRYAGLSMSFIGLTYLFL
ncbi:HupE/UreJ family protein [Candidatus Peregrinibacteria bacterium]|nr:MAG: HupE/UreJ family protein [Candidatus Peregrinibacteria bacterium]